MNQAQAYCTNIMRQKSRNHSKDSSRGTPGERDCTQEWEVRDTRAHEEPQPENLPDVRCPARGGPRRADRSPEELKLPLVHTTNNLLVQTDKIQSWEAPSKIRNFRLANSVRRTKRADRSSPSLNTEQAPEKIL